jgi:redox-sensitive bicupin YhaK (pirin superfamily)
MPQRSDGTSMGFQLWVNLPRSHKLMEPRYRGITSREIPEAEREDGVRIKVISGEVDGVAGPVEDIVVDVRYLDVAVPPGITVELDVEASHSTFAYVFEGHGTFGEGDGEEVSAKHLALFGNGERVRATASGSPLRFLLVSGKPIGEPVAWRGPIVMNTDEEIETAFREYSDGTFIKRG